MCLCWKSKWFATFSNFQLSEIETFWNRNSPKSKLSESWYIRYHCLPLIQKFDSCNYSKFQYFYVCTHKIITFQSSVFLLRHFSVLLVVLHNSRKRAIFLGSFFCTYIFNYFFSNNSPVLFPVYKREIEKKNNSSYSYW